jgi:hypothetical protein
VAKAKNNPRPVKRQRKAKVAAAHESPLDRISVDEAFHLMLVQFQPPHAARHRLDMALRAEEVLLWANGVPQDPNFIAAHLRVAARTEPDGRWIACIEPTRALVPGEYVWAVSRAGVVDLMRREAPKSRVDLKPREGPQISRLWPVLRDLYPPDGIPSAKVKTNEVCAAVERIFEAREQKLVSRKVISIAIGRSK